MHRHVSAILDPRVPLKCDGSGFFPLNPWASSFKSESTEGAEVKCYDLSPCDAVTTLLFRLRFLCVVDTRLMEADMVENEMGRV